MGQRIDAARITDVANTVHFLLSKKEHNRCLLFLDLCGKNNEILELENRH